MEKLRKATVAFFVFNCLSIAVFACNTSVNVDGVSCPLSSQNATSCTYTCPNQGGTFTKPKAREFEMEQSAY